ncbi:UNVERIFIED_CONTAM: hypothetical protein HHA_462520 [Hammondia hammondi]|eukprot:XP_008887188.1 hypothetical protein HHA_462520 [Hammondia hammondi]
MSPREDGRVTREAVPASLGAPGGFSREETEEKDEKEGEKREEDREGEKEGGEEGEEGEGRPSDDAMLLTED